MSPFASVFLSQIVNRGGYPVSQTEQKCEKDTVMSCHLFFRPIPAWVIRKEKCKPHTLLPHWSMKVERDTHTLSRTEGSKQKNRFKRYLADAESLLNHSALVCFPGPDSFSDFLSTG